MSILPAASVFGGVDTRNGRAHGTKAVVVSPQLRSVPTRPERSA